MLAKPKYEMARRAAPAPPPFKEVSFSKTWTFFNGDWRPGNAAVMGARTHATWLGSLVFDGARAFEGTTPDLDLHCARVNTSAASFLLQPALSVDEWVGLVADGLKRFDRHAELYIRPMYWAETGSPGGIRHDPESTRWCLCIYEGGDPQAKRRFHHAVALPTTDGGMCPGRGQGRVSLSQQCPRDHGGAATRLR
jgi:hypothetical protein